MSTTLLILYGNDGHDLGKDDHDIGNDAHDADNGDHSVIHIINLGVSCDLGNWLTLGGCLTGGGTWKVEGNEGTPKKMASILLSDWTNLHLTKSELVNKDPLSAKNQSCKVKKNMG